MVDELVLSQQNQPQIYPLTHQIAQVGVIRIIFSWMAILFEVFQKTTAKHH